MSARAEITPEVVREVERIGFMRPVYKPDPELRKRIREDLRSYGLEGFALLEIAGYEVTLSEIPGLIDTKTRRGRVEKQTWIELIGSLKERPLGTFFLLQSPREDAVGYFKEVWYAGVKSGQDSAQMYDMRIPLSDEAPPLSLSLYTKIHNRLSPEIKLFSAANPHDMVKHPVVLPPEEAAIDRFIDVWADAVYEEESLLLDKEYYKRQLREEIWKKKQEEIDALIEEQVVEKLARSVETGSKVDFIYHLMSFEREMQRYYNTLPRGSCGAACMLLASKETKQPYLANKETGKGLVLLDLEKCTTCKKVKNQCGCQAKAKSDLAKAA